MKVLTALVAAVFAAAGQSPPLQAPAPPAPPVEAQPGKPVPAAESFQSAMEKQRAAMQVQRESVRKQQEMAREWRSPPLSATLDVDCEPIPEVELTPLIDRAAQSQQIDSKLLRGVMQQESAFRACAVSSKGARGLMQLMPATLEQFKVDDPFDPQENLAAGAAFLKQLMEKYKGDLKLVLAAYNAGPGAVDKSGGIPDIKETQNYVETILKKLNAH
ncbi:MAG: lytic transglycosylase domain-containing protein [Candidatus Solibacter sp.]